MTGALAALPLVPGLCLLCQAEGRVMQETLGPERGAPGAH